MEGGMGGLDLHYYTMVNDSKRVHYIILERMMSGDKRLLVVSV